MTQFKAVRKALRFLKENPAHPSLHTHKYDSLIGPDNTEVFEAYAQNKTPGAYRIFWCYYPPKKEDKAEKGKTTQSRNPPQHPASQANPEEEQPATITVIAITPHP